jgi:glyoxylase-like metal-dependent hydrolase (beta-lactamase superfamily II)
MTRIELPEHDIVGIRAANPGPYTLSGTNSWIVGHGPGWLVDPGPDIEEHVAALATELRQRGGLGGIALTHDHGDHAEALASIRRRFPTAPVAGMRGNVDVQLGEGSKFGPLIAVPTPGHSPDHIALVCERAAFTGDAVLGEGSVFISPDPGALVSYLAALGALRARGLAVLCPGHGPVVHDPERKLEEYIAHRLDRERRLLDALAAGNRSVQELLDAVWYDAPIALRPAATATLAAHLDKLAGDGLLPADVERPLSVN